MAAQSTRTNARPKDGDFVCVEVKRGNRLVYGFGVVCGVSIGGMVSAYTDRHGVRRRVGDDGIVQTWIVYRAEVDPEGLWGHWLSRGGRPFDTLNEATAFVQPFRKW